MMLKTRKAERDRLRRLTDLPNVGPATAECFEQLGIRQPEDLKGKDPYALYAALCRKRGRQDPCLLDTFIAVTRYLAGEPARPWWAYTKERKRRYGPV